MLKGKYKKICAVFFVISLLLQIIPVSVQAKKTVSVESVSSESSSEKIEESTAQSSSKSMNETSSSKSMNETSSSESTNETSSSESTDESETQKEENKQQKESETKESTKEDTKQENSKKKASKQKSSSKQVSVLNEPASKVTVVDNKVELKSTADFIALSNQEASTYEDAEITITRNDANTFDLTSQTSDGNLFKGFGSEDHPFKGKIVVTSGTTSNIDISVNCSFFNYLSQDATIGAGLYLKSKGNMNTPLLAEYFVKGSKDTQTSNNISLKIGAEKGIEEQISFGGIIGTMENDTNLTLSVQDDISTNSKPNIMGESDIGFFCNTMKENARLTISSYNKSSIDYDVSTTKGCAGGLVGVMKDGASLTINQALQLTGEVKTTGTSDSTSGSAGGLVGLAQNASITLKGEVTCTGTVQGVTESGGYIGKAFYNSTQELNLEKVKIQGLTISEGHHAGGFFGVLNNGCSAGGTLTIENANLEENEDKRVTHTGTSWQFGGVIGQYSANSKRSTLRIKSPNVAITGDGTITVFGGVIGFIAAGNETEIESVIQDATAAYVEIQDATVDAQCSNNLTVREYFGGLVAEMKGAEHFLSVSGNTKVTGSDNGKPGEGLGGILGKGDSGVLRINGITDLSDFTIAKTGTGCGQIVGSIDGTIVYAKGSGNGSTNTSDTNDNKYNWKFIRPSEVSVSDIGSYGEVIRLDGSSLKEEELFDYDSNSHNFEVKYTNISDEDLKVASKRDLVALAILMQKGSIDLRKTITITSNDNIDLTGTGIYSILRDDGTQIYTGTFDGNNKTITVAAGEAYGYTSDDKLAVNSDSNSNTVGIGQIYNHSTIGFIPYCNGTVQYLTLEGSIYFHNVSYGVEVRCGAVAGYTDGATATFMNITTKTKIVYRDGKGGDGLSMISIGGLVGRASSTSTVNFNTCSMQGSISSASGCHDFAIGGYLAAVDESEDTTKATVNFTSCSISNASITHEKFADNSSAPNAMFGGLIGRMVGSVTIDGLEIDNLSMNSYASTTSGGLLGYYWRKKDPIGSMTITGLTVKNSSLNVGGKFGGLVYSTNAYWKIGDGSTNNSGIHFEGTNTFKGKTDENLPSALLICSTVTDEDSKSDRKDKAYIEIQESGLTIDDGSVDVTLTGGNYFDDIVGKTEYGEDGKNSILSIGLTKLNANTVTLIDQDNNNTWKNHCTVNDNNNYTNKNTRYYYNVDYYRKQVENTTTVTDIDTPGKLLLRSIYVHAQKNLQDANYFVKGSDALKLTGNIDLSGVSYYPISSALNIEGATITFDYSKMNKNASKKYSDSTLQHYQMQTGLFSATSQKFSIKNLTLCGTFGKYRAGSAEQAGAAGVLICESIAQSNNNESQAGITIDGLTLDGVYCVDTNASELPLLINYVGTNTAISMNNVTYTREKYTSIKQPIASALMGQVGESNAQKVSLEFANMDLNRKDENKLFSKAIFATAFQYADGASSGSYNFESNTEKITFGKEISNGVTDVADTKKHNRNSYDVEKTTGQVWYLDTFGKTEAGSYVGEDKGEDSPQDFSKYLPYIGEPENSENHYYELDINQLAVYLVDGCGTYGHPWAIADVSRTSDEHKTLFTGEDQMITVMKLLDSTGRNGTALKINKTVLETKIEGQGSVSIHTNDDTNDVILIKNGDTWVEAEKSGDRYKANYSSSYSVTNEQVMAYLRNGYFLIKKDLTLNVKDFTGLGGMDVSHAFSGVIIGETGENKTSLHTITLTGTNETGKVGGLIRYSQGSVVKDLEIKFENVTFTRTDKVNENREFFGGVIGWVIGGDNIIDNVIVNGESINGVDNSETSLNLTPVGGYVGLVGGYDDNKGGGVIFRNISSTGLTLVNNQATTTEVEKSNDKYYWNPYVGRVFDGYACAEEDTCSLMEDNTDKNYKIPKLNKTDKLKIEGNEAKKIKDVGSIYPNSTIKLDSTQAIWLLSAIVNSGFGAKVYGGDYINSGMVEASYYGRTRIGTYDNVGKDSYSARDEIDETDYWGGKIENTSDDKKADTVDHRQHSTSYLSTYVDSGSLDAKAVTYSLTADCSGAGRRIEFTNGTYDLRDYGNGFRGIGYSYGNVPLYRNSENNIGNESQNASKAKAKALKLQDKNTNCAVNGNNATIKYCRKIYEYQESYKNNDTTTKCIVYQAGFFSQCLSNSNATYTVKNLKFEDVEVTRKGNFHEDYVALGIVFARDGTYSPDTLNFQNVEVKNSSLDQADYSAALLGYMTGVSSNNTKNINFEECTVDGFTAGETAEKMNHCGGLIGKVEAKTNRKIEFQNCTSKNITMKNVQNGGLLGGYILVPCTVNNSHVENGTITSRNVKSDSGNSMGGLIGKVESTSLKIIDSTSNDIKIDGTTATTNNVCIGGLVGSATGTASIQNATAGNIKAVGKGCAGGAIGQSGDTITAQNVEIKNSYLINNNSSDNQNIGGLVGNANGFVSGFNLLSKDNVLGYLKETSWDFEQLSAEKVDLKLKENRPCGIWVGNANSNAVKLVSVSRQGASSAVKNIGAGKKDNSYAIYTDYTGQATKSSELNVKPSTNIMMADKELTSDGASTVENIAVRNTIITDTMANNLNKGYYGGETNRSLDSIVSQFSSTYKNRLTTYKAEDSSYTGTDFPILVLHSATKAELNGIVNSYISMLTNVDQTETSYGTINPQTYKYQDSKWTKVSDAEQTMSWTASDGIKINRGKYDNNKNQITILDVTYKSQIFDSTDEYHLYIPVLVKKLMDVKCSVQVVNGAVGYTPDNISSEATLNSFGENYTAQISYNYEWTVSEWKSMLENKDSLLWNFDKTVKLGELEKFDQKKVHLTLIDLNTHGDKTSYYQGTLKELQDMKALDDNKLDLATMADEGYAPYICDLLPLKAEKDAQGTFKIVEENDTTAVLRIWENNKFTYYAPKTAEDSEDAYAITLDTALNSEETLTITEQYYLVMNCTEGNENVPMLNTKVELNKEYKNTQIPTKVTNSSSSDESADIAKNYIVGDFYKIDDFSLVSTSANNGALEMESGTNDTIKVNLSSKVTAAANENEFGAYVDNRSIYYQYFVQLVDQDSKSVDMKGAVSVTSLTMEKTDADGNITKTTLNPVADLDGENVFTTQRTENGYLITIKALGKEYTGATIKAEMNFSYNSAELNEQFPYRKDNSVGVQFKANAVMAYQQESLGSSCITASTNNENRLYYRVQEDLAKLSYDSYNITSKDGNTSQLGINGRENNDQPTEIKSRALLDASNVSGLNLTDSSSEQYPYYLEGELSLAKKTKTAVSDDKVVGKEYEEVSIGSYLEDFIIESGNATVDMASDGLGLQKDGKTFKFRISLTSAQVSDITNTPLLVNINYKVKTGSALEKIEGGQYANYKVTLSATLKNKDDIGLITSPPSDYLIYTNAKVYLGIIGITDVGDGN